MYFFSLCLPLLCITFAVMWFAYEKVQSTYKKCETTILKLKKIYDNSTQVSDEKWLNMFLDDFKVIQKEMTEKYKTITMHDINLELSLAYIEATKLSKEESAKVPEWRKSIAKIDYLVILKYNFIEKDKQYALKPVTTPPKNMLN